MAFHFFEDYKLGLFKDKNFARSLNRTCVMHPTSDRANFLNGRILTEKKTT